MDVEEASCSNSDYSEDIRQNEKEIIGQQLVEERRNNKLLE